MHNINNERISYAYVCVILQTNPIETYGNNSVCVDGVRSLSSHSCGTYIEQPVMSLCVVQETYTVNGSNQYALKIEGTYCSYVARYRENNFYLMSR